MYCVLTTMDIDVDRARRHVQRAQELLGFGKKSSFGKDAMQESSAKGFGKTRAQVPDSETSSSFH